MRTTEGRRSQAVKTPERKRRHAARTPRGRRGQAGRIDYRYRSQRKYAGIPLRMIPMSSANAAVSDTR